MSKSFPIWRSRLFVPAHVPKFVDAAHARGADAYLLDLEDSVPLAQKGEARAALASAVSKVSQSGAAALVRVNTDDTLTPDDLNAAVQTGARALMVPKVESAAQVQALDARICELERERGLRPGNILLIAQIEHVRALLAAYDEAAAQGRGALEFRGRMVDMPVVLRARELLRRVEAIRATP